MKHDILTLPDLCLLSGSMGALPSWAQIELFHRNRHQTGSCRDYYLPSGWPQEPVCIQEKPSFVDFLFFSCFFVHHHSFFYSNSEIIAMLLTIQRMDPEGCSTWWEPLHLALTVARPKSPIFTVSPSCKKMSTPLSRKFQHKNTSWI